MIRLSIDQIRAIRALCHMNTDLRTRYHDERTKQDVESCVINNYYALFNTSDYKGEQKQYAIEQIMRGS